MIEVKSWPSDLVAWSRLPEEQQPPFYLEFFGETEPYLDQTYAEVVPAAAKAEGQTQGAPVYEYWWTLGHRGAQDRDSWWRRQFGDQSSDRDPEPWENLKTTAARVYLYFPISGGWRFKELVATVKYLSPIPEQHSWMKTVGKDLQALQPLAGDAAGLAGLVPGGGTASKWLEAVSKLQVASVPQQGKLNWSVGKVTFGSEDHGPMQGVMWQLPKAMFRLLGGRLTGSLAMSFIPAPYQDVGPQTPQPMKALAHAVLYHQNGTESWLPNHPDGRDFVELSIRPRLPQ